MSDDSADKGHADEIFGLTAYEAAERQKRTFLPWHRPRKHFVRDRQWRIQIEALLADIQLEDRTLRYFGLPGADLLDLRYFHSTVCEPNNIGLRFLGFDYSANPASGAQTDLNISLDEVRRLAMVDPRSDILGDDFCKVANDDSIAWRKAHDLGPYDVVNLDLCDGLGIHAPSALDDTHYNAINRLLSLQSRHKRPWLLLLTTRAGEQHLHPEVLHKFVDKYLQNLESCSPFLATSLEKFDIGNAMALRKAAKTEIGLLVISLAGLCKWLVGLAIEQSPPSTLEVRSIVGYRVATNSACEDMVSLAIRFQPTFAPVPDVLRLATRRAEPPNECDLSTKILRRIAKRKNADLILAADSALQEEMRKSMAALLEIARYDTDAFYAWLEELR
jgi:hypothetical protein